MNKFRIIVQSGYELLKSSPGRVGLYLILTFVTQTLIPVALVPTLLAKVTNSVAQQAPTGAGVPSNVHVPQHSSIAPSEKSSTTAGSTKQDVVRPYLEWLFLIVALIPLNIWFRLSQTDLDNGMEIMMRNRIFANVLQQPPEFFQSYDPGQLANTVTQMVTQAQQAFRSLTIDPLMQLLNLVIATSLIVIQLRTLSGGVVWVTVVMIVLLGIFTVYIVQSKTKNAVTNCQLGLQQQFLEVAGLATSVMSAPQDIQAMGAEELFVNKFRGAVATLCKRKRTQIATMELVNSLLGFPTQLVLACLFGFVVFAVTSGKPGAAPGTIVAFSYLVPRLMEPFKTFAALGLIATSSWPAVDLFLRFSTLPSRITDLPGASETECVEPTLEARGVTFQYPSKDSKIFDNVSFEVPARRITGFVGRFGQGKTTLFRLALRFYDPQNGDIRLGGHPTTALKLRSLRKQISMMPQNPTFFHLSVRDNFRMANPDVTDDEIRRMAEKTGLWSILVGSYGPDPFDRPFAAGMALSGGQKRKFSLTLALLRDSRFLFLDEPSAGLSADELQDLISTIRTACAGRTVIVVDHLLPAFIVPLCDYVLVLDNGKIVQRGDPQQLLLQEGEFRILYDAQLPQAQSVVAD